MTAAGDRPRVVLDCNVLLQAAINPNGPAARCVRLVEANRVNLYISRATVREITSVLRYPAVQDAFPGLTDEAIRTFLDRAFFKATLVHRVRHVLDYPRAKQDEPYIDLAATVRANFLVSRDKDLLSLMTGHSAVCKSFRRITHPLRVVDPVALLVAIEAR